MDWIRTKISQIIAILFVTTMLMSGCNESRDAVAPESFAPPPSPADEKSGTSGIEKG